jgi:hypothetical protein
MNALTIETLRIMAEARGLTLSDDELGGLLPLVEAGRATMAALEVPAGSDLEPSCQYRIL